MKDIKKNFINHKTRITFFKYMRLLKNTGSDNDKLHSIKNNGIC